ncbi:MAG: PorV/PorQ family protein, partial [Candidatus Latescibacteria bacterium]|nr:PorV/PorQ family protein [Candidatus Latescibacterota bacterium]
AIMLRLENSTRRAAAGRGISPLLWQLLSVCILIPLVAGSAAAGLSGIPGILADIGYGARPVAMGGAYVALADDANSIAWNSAGLINLQSKQATFMYANQMSLVPYYFAAYGQKFAGTQAHSEAIIYTGDEVLSETTVLLAYAYSARKLLSSPFDRLQAGLCLKLRRVSFGNNSDGGEERSQGSGSGFGLDLGAQWQVTDKFTFGLALYDLLNNVSYDNKETGKYSEAAPTQLTIGVATRPSANVVVALDFKKSLYQDSEDALHFGVERTYLNFLALRAGFSQILGPEPPRNFSVGLGIKSFGGNFRLDLAYLFQELNNTPRLSTTVLF